MTDTQILTPAALDRAAASALVDQAAGLLSDARAILQRDAGNRERYCPRLDVYVHGLDVVTGEMDQDEPTTARVTSGTP